MTYNLFCLYLRPFIEFRNYRNLLQKPKSGKHSKTI